MSIYKTFKEISHKGTINGTRYHLEAFTSYYHPYDSINIGIERHAPKKRIDVGIFILVQGNNSLCRSMATDQFGNEWYIADDSIKYIAYAEGMPLNDEPTYFWDACQAISRHAGLPKKADGYYEYCYSFLAQNKSKRPFEGEYVPRYEEMFAVDFKVGEKAYFVQHYDRETRNGERYQIHSFTVKAIEYHGPNIFLLDYDPELTSGTVWNYSIEHKNCCKSVEELCERYKGQKLYMWHRDGGCRIEPCSSTSIFDKYNKE